MKFAAGIVSLSIAALLTACGESSPSASIEKKADASAENAPASVAGPQAELVPPTGSRIILAPNTAPDGNKVEDCSVDVFKGASGKRFMVGRSDDPEVAGWIADRKAHQVPSSIQIALVGANTFAGTATTGEDRPDVAAALADPALSKSGYRAILDLTGVEPGSYRLALSYNSAAQRFVCHPGVVIDIQS